MFAPFNFAVLFGMRNSRNKGHIKDFTVCSLELYLVHGSANYGSRATSGPLTNFNWPVLAFWTCTSNIPFTMFCVVFIVYVCFFHIVTILKTPILSLLILLSETLLLFC